MNFIFATMKEATLARVRYILDSKNLVLLDSLDTILPGYADLLVRTMRDSYEYAKKGAADELRLPSPATKRETMALFSRNTDAVVQKQLADLVFAVKSEVLSEARKGPLADLHAPTVLKAASTAMDDFLKNEMALGGSAAVAIAINRGRGDVFEGYHDKIATYTWSAILDKKTCPTCFTLDGWTFDYATYQSTQWKPPIHFHDRCIIVATLKDQKEIPPFTEFPKDLPMTEPAL